MVLLWRTLVRASAGRGRLLGLAALGGVAVLLGAGLASGDPAEALDDGTTLVSTYGLALLVPVVTLVFASSVLGDPSEDGTLVYLWLRPVARWRLVGTAVGAALALALPLTVVPLGLAAAATGGGSRLVAATVVVAVLGVVAYAGIFSWLGLRVRRALLWGVLYVLVWEGFVARAGDTVARLALRTSTRSLLSHLAGAAPPEAALPPVASVAVLLLAGAGGAALAARRLSRQEVA